MDSFPPIDVDDLATSDDLTFTTHARRPEIGDVRVETAELEVELRGETAEVHREMAELKTEVRTEIAEVRRELAELRSEVRTEIAQLRVEMAELRTELRVELEKTRSEFRKDMATNTRMMIASNMASTLGFAALVIGFA